MEQAFSHAAIGQALLSLDGRFTRVNDALCRLVGYSSAELLRPDLQSITHPDDLSVELELVERVLRGELETYALEKRYLKPDGSALRVLVTASVVRDEQRRPRYFTAQMQDASGRRTAESARWLAALVENSSDSIMGVDGRGIIQSWNTGAQRLFGYTAAEMIGRRSDVLIPPGRTDELEEVLGDHEQFIDSFRFETERVRKDRTLVEVAFTASRVRDDQGNGLGWSLVARDVTESNRLQAELSRAKELMEATFSSIGDGVALLDAEWRPLLVNDAYRKLLALPETPLADKEPTFLSDHIRQLVDDPASLPEDLGVPLADHETRTSELLLVRPVRRWLRRSTTAIASGRERLHLVIWRDITTERDTLAEREREIATDTLTGIPNRRAALARAKEVRRRGHMTSVALFDIDHFKQVNDRFGHAKGDEVLRAVATTLAHQACGSDLIARWGGEEFVAIVGADVAGATALCERAREAVGRLEIPGVGRVTISVGVSAISDDFDPALERADAALYQAKARGRNRVERG
ncbi:MAG TPA: PAS domain S-box protein [Polyangiaceae bacterium]|nr:PAS domain S-box protein [Polyangiaceae bacterium]